MSPRGGAYHGKRRKLRPGEVLRPRECNFCGQLFAARYRTRAGGGLTAIDHRCQRCAALIAAQAPGVDE